MDLCWSNFYKENILEKNKQKIDGSTLNEENKTLKKEDEKEDEFSLQLNIGTIGHVDHGKTTLTAALTQVSSIYFSSQSKEYSYEEIDKTPEEKRRGITINATHVEYYTPFRKYVHVDCPGHEHYIKNMITGAMQLDVAILVISSADGPQEQTIEHLLLARQIGLDNLLIFLNKIDIANDLDMFELVCFEVFDLVDTYDFSNLAWSAGSAVCALEKPDSFWGESIRSVLDLIDFGFLVPDRDLISPFLMPIKEAFSVTGRGTVVTGFVEQGCLKVGSEIEILGVVSNSIKTNCIGIEAFHKSQEETIAGHNVGLLLRGVKREDILRGQVVCIPNSQKLVNKVLAEVYTLKGDEGGRSGPIYEGYKPQMFIRTADVTVSLSLENKLFKPFLTPGDVSDVVFYLETPLALVNGLRFALREGKTTIGFGIILKTLE